jgi:hypothetical protein
MMQSDMLRTIDNSAYVMVIGLNSIIHVFKVVLSTTKDVDKTYTQCQKAYYCYLEYIEQMNKTNLLHNLNNLNAILFVYKKTVAIESAVNELETDRPLTNHFFSVGELYHNTRTDPEFSGVLDLISCATKTILFFTNEIYFETKNQRVGTMPPNDKIFSIEKMVKLTENHLQKILVLCTGYPLLEYDYKILFDYTQFIQEKMGMDYENYDAFLFEFYKKIKQLKRANKLPSTADTNTNQLNYFYQEESLRDLTKMLETKKYGAFVKTLFTF